MSTLPAATPPNPADTSSKERGFFGHPRMLSNLFMVEMWERFSYYGMQSIMLYYLYYSATEGGLGLNETAAAGVMGAYGGMVYLLAILGGFLGDRVLGPERTLFYAAIGIMAGHVALAIIPGVPGVVVGLVLVAIGSGCLKTNASVLVGSLYSREDPKRDGGFTIFYMGVNLGALIGPLLTGLGWASYGFHFGFGLAALGMALGLAQYSLTRKNLPASVHHVSEPLSATEKRNSALAALAIIAVVALLVATKMINPDNIATWVMALVGILGAGIFFMLFTSKKTTEVEHSRILSFLPMMLGNIVFFALFQQQFSVLAIYSESRVNWNIFGVELPVSWFNSINPIFILLFGAVFTAMWTKMGDRQPTTPKKFAIGLILIGTAFLIFLLLAGNTHVNVMWLVLILFFCTLGELSISPVGTSLASKLAPEAYRVMMMALYFCSVSMGTVLAGWLAQFYSLENEVPYFTAMGLISIATGIVIFALNKWIVKKMAGIR
ncbi:peptide MFS transporter [Rothia sp. L_38]|uniref:peptide MFS transporter n=1 Tax=Rothia sp. L_38 TaxID=3422315 RepID=UPI003D6B9CE5